MLKSRNRFLLHATVYRSEADSAGFDDAKAGHPVERRLNRLERVAVAYHGQLDLRFPSGMLVSFESADSALLGACEMQHRCAVLPQPSQQKLTLRIGIYQCIVKERAKDGEDDIEQAREIAERLAQADDSILVAQSVHDAADANIRKLARTLSVFSVDDAPVFAIDWRREIPSAAYGGESFWPSSILSQPSGPRLTLFHGTRTIELSERNPLLTIGRDPLSDLVLADTHVSRTHCRIECTGNGILLTDLSTNGTSVVTEGGQESLVKKGSIALSGKGMLLFGRPFRGERRGGLRFESA